jgi:hypothetical protein
MNAERKRNDKTQLNPDQGRVAFHQVLKGLRDRSIVADGVNGGLLPHD